MSNIFRALTNPRAHSMDVEGGKTGFTLIELLIVIAIIGILAAIIIPNFSKVRRGGRDAARISTVRNTVLAIENYVTDKGSPPSTTACLAGIGAGCAGINYLPVDPKDPLDGTTLYGYGANGAIYQVWTELETKNSNLSSDLDQNGAGWTGNPAPRAGTDGRPTTAPGPGDGKEACANSTITDAECVFDLGSPN